MFITLEGIEGSGKTRQLDTVARFVRGRGLDCIVTREPGGTRLGAGIRGLLLDPANAGMDPYTELLLYVADRVQHVREVILPALGAGKGVVCDRFADATAVYQGVARGLERQKIGALHRLVLDDLAPDLTLLIDVPAELGLERAWNAVNQGGRRADETRFEREALDFHRRVRQGYLALAAAEPRRFRVVDGRPSPEAVGLAIQATLARFFANLPPGGTQDG